MHLSCVRRNVYDPAFMRRVKRTLSAYKKTVAQSSRSSVSREAFVDIDEKGASWYLGHMQSTSSALREKVKDADFVLEIRDARLPFTTENMNLRKMTGMKPRLIIFNKAELSNENSNRIIQQYYESAGCYALFTSARRSWRDIVEVVRRFTTHILPPQRFKTSAHIGLVVGMPNVGKSTLINALRLAHEYQFHRQDWRRSRTPEAVSVTPGTTRSLKLVPLCKDPNVVLYDSPGLTLPGCFAKESGLKLAACGIIPTNNISLPYGVVARYIYDLMVAAGSREHLAECLHLSRAPISFDDCIAMICERSGTSAQTDLGNLDPVRAQRYLVHDFQLGNLGKITLDPLPRKFQSTLASHDKATVMLENGKVRASASGPDNCGGSGSGRASRHVDEDDTQTGKKSGEGRDSIDDDAIVTHEVHTTDVYNRFEDHMRDILQTLQGHPTFCSKTEQQSQQASSTSAVNDHNSKQGSRGSRNTERQTHNSNNNSSIADVTQMVISRKKGPISRATAYDESMRRNTRLAPGR